jgi:hypothetical protein
MTVELAMRILGKPLVLLTLSAGSLAGIAAGLLLARWRGWRTGPTMLAGAGLALVAAVTLARGPLPPGYADSGLCVMNGFALGGYDVKAHLFDPFVVLNFLMFMPFAFFAALATRRIVPVVAASVVLTMGIEAAQTLTGTGSCETQDLTNNIAGALVAAVVGGLAARRLGPDRRRPSTEIAPVHGEDNALV